ncbi:MAG TPA: NAD-dependent epimerase/dehydratase family protein [Kiritimatiellia bacterium]|nr:NAD-dependent epimerase/dehydratase family protein [Kiritimatiellia bacterium]
MNVLITGGAGFIGSHTMDALRKRGYRVRILDNLSKPVHLKGKPSYLPSDVEFILGDVRDKELLRKCLQGIDVVYHLAAYQDYLPDFSTFFSVNAVSTALLYEIIVEDDLPVKKVIVASSQSVAGEGLYQSSNGDLWMPDMRSEKQLASAQWETIDTNGQIASPVPTPSDRSNPQNPYGLSKLSQEKACISLGRRYNIPSVAMRYSIVQGPRQSFYNAYSGACRIFCLSVYFDKAPVIYEDGKQLRDFVNIHDVVDANLKVLDDERADYRVFNVGGGRPYTINEFAGIVCRVFDKDLPIASSGLYRFGDTRHCISDISALRSLGWSPRRTAEESVAEYVEYLKAQTDIEDILEFANRKMKDLNVVRKAATA